ncbi:putative mitochondrial protein [Sesamum angolense]|uniref:Mitochondrial protein n=1 Tax=Sesamum angolense TaxID=2727404 RepID=A0AAE1WAL7_9LAMI|nr:putative mitochondrial protein [Sesamum angolense]
MQIDPEIKNAMWLICYTHAQGEQCSFGPDGPPRVCFSIDKKKKLFTLDWFEKRIGPFLPLPDDLGIPPIAGRQGQSLEGAGKRRIFAMGNHMNQRWPLVVLFEVFQSLFDWSFASAVVNSALACNIFEVPFSRRRQSSVSFVTGQPLGYYASWPLFALSHHLWCGDVGPNLPTTFFVLGRGKPLNPYLKGFLVEYLRKETKPVD